MKRCIALSFALALLIPLGCGDDSAPEKKLIVNVNNHNNGDTNNGMFNNQNNGTTNNANNGDNNGTNGNNGGNNVNDNCPAAARPVYTVEVDQVDPNGQGTLVRFDPQDLKFTDIGDLDCPAPNGDTPFSMSVDRAANAWVLYSSGNVFKVSTTDASCEATDFQPGQQGYDVFGMGFVLDRPNLEAETLYVAGGAGPGIGDGARIGFIDFPGMELTHVSTLAGWPEMSGTAASELWAFFPGTFPPRIARIIPATGEEVEVIEVTGIDGDPNAWAFAHWGGDFYLFYKNQTDVSTRVFKVDREAETTTEVISDTGRYIVGAGVSTCAPLYIL